MLPRTSDSAHPDDCLDPHRLDPHLVDHLDDRPGAPPAITVDLGSVPAPDADPTVVHDLAVVTAPPSEVPGLSERQLAVLALERRRYRHQGVKEQAVRQELDLSSTRYHQVLNALLDDPAALAHDPVLVLRLRRLRDERTAGCAP